MGATVSRYSRRRPLELKHPFRLALRRAKYPLGQPHDLANDEPASWLHRLAVRPRSSKVHAVNKKSDNVLEAVSPSQELPCWCDHDEGFADSPRDEVTQQDAACQVDTTELAKCATPDTANSAPIKWRKGERLGCGAYGSVYMGLNAETGGLLAVKEIASCVRDSPHQREAVHQLEQEIALLSKLSHPNVLRYLGTVREGTSLFIFLEYVPGGSIASIVSRFGPLDEPIVRSYTRQLLSGLAYLHAQRIVHRDIKGANLLVEKDGLVKVADMGMAKEMEAMSVTKSFKGSPFWMAPEMVRQQGHGWPADIWSVGCTVLEMATGKPPWSECTTQVQAIFKIASSNDTPAFPEALSPAGLDFLKLCLQRDPHRRPTAQQLQQHPWVAGVDVHLPPAAPLHCTQQQLALLATATYRHAAAGPNMTSHNSSSEDDAVQADDAGKDRATRPSQVRAKHPQQQQQPRIAGKPRHSSPKRNKASTAAAVALASAATTRTMSVPGRGSRGGAAIGTLAKQQVGGQLLRQRLSRGSAPVVGPSSMAGAAVIYCAAAAAPVAPAALSNGAVSPPGGFRRLRSRTITAEDALGSSAVAADIVDSLTEQLLLPPHSVAAVGPALTSPCSGPG